MYTTGYLTTPTIFSRLKRHPTDRCAKACDRSGVHMKRFWACGVVCAVFLLVAGCGTQLSFTLRHDAQGAVVEATGPFQGENFMEQPAGTGFKRTGYVTIAPGGPYHTCIAVNGLPLDEGFGVTYVSMFGPSDMFPNNIGLSSGCVTFAMGEDYTVRQVRETVKIRLNDQTHHNYAILFDNGAAAPFQEIATSHYITDWPTPVTQGEVRNFTLLRDNEVVDPATDGLDIRLLTENDIMSVSHPCVSAQVATDYEFTFVIPPTDSECSIR